MQQGQKRCFAGGSSIPPPPPPALHGTQQVSREASGPVGSDICFVTYTVITKKTRKNSCL